MTRSWAKKLFPRWPPSGHNESTYELVQMYQNLKFCGYFLNNRIAWMKEFIAWATVLQQTWSQRWKNKKTFEAHAFRYCSWDDERHNARYSVLEHKSWISTVQHNTQIQIEYYFKFGRFNSREHFTREKINKLFPKKLLYVKVLMFAKIWKSFMVWHGFNLHFVRRVR